MQAVKGELSKGKGEQTAMESDDAREIVIREALRRLGSEVRPDISALREIIAEVVKQQGEAIFAELSEAARQQLRREGFMVNEQTARLERIKVAIDYGRSLIANYKVETLGELPPEEQQEFARLWANATGGVKLNEN
jgi:HEPN domain-containing protein